MLKASEGGGGKGVRKAITSDQIETMYQQACLNNSHSHQLLHGASEFACVVHPEVSPGDPSLQVCDEVKGSPVFLMRLCSNARHVEIQLMCDKVPYANPLSWAGVRVTIRLKLKFMDRVMVMIRSRPGSGFGLVRSGSGTEGWGRSWLGEGCGSRSAKTPFLLTSLASPQHRNVSVLSGRDCSMQRRFQKIVEEGPPTAVPPETMREMELAAGRWRDESSV